MRAWAAVGAFLVLVSTAVAEPPADSEVPPLAGSESAPADAPNYFDPRELGATTLAPLAACQGAVTSASPELDETTRTGTARALPRRRARTRAASAPSSRRIGLNHTKYAEAGRHSDIGGGRGSVSM